MLGSGSSLKLATIFGIRVGVNASWFVVLFLFIFWFQSQFTDALNDSTLGFVTAVLTALGFFGSILLHELGHALAARREGIHVTGIDLFMFGGFMKMSSDTQSPGQEFRVAIAGPLVTLLIALVGGAIGVATMGWDEFFDSATLQSGATAVVFQLWLSFLVSINLVLLAFNLVPAFPLDGGRIARAVAWKVTGDRTRATRVAAFLGQLFAAALIGWGVWQLVASSDAFGGLWYIALGWLLGSGARAAVVQSAFTAKLEGVTVADVMDAEPVTIPGDLPAERAWDEYFLRYQGWMWFPVVDAEGRYLGLAHRAAVDHVVHQEGGSLPMRRVAAPAGDDGSIRSDASLETLLGSEPLRRLGVLMAIDADGRLRGIVTRDHVTRALQTRLAPS